MSRRGGISAAFSVLLVVPALHLLFGFAAGAQTPDRDGVRAFQAIDAPRPDRCVTEVSPGDHVFSCEGLTYQVVVDELCVRVSCGLIVDVHGAGMSGRVMRDATQLHLLAPGRGYLVVHPSARPDNVAGSWNLVEDPARMRSFVDRVISVFQVDGARIHFTGFSMGAAMTFAFLCNHNDLLASTAVMTGVSADQVRALDGERRCVDSFDEAWRPRVPILFMNGIDDPALSREAAGARTDRIVSGLGLTGGAEVAREDGHFVRRSWTDGEGMVFDFLEHEYGTPGNLGGHCIPRGGIMPGSQGTLETNAVVCTTGEPTLHWGEVAVRWFEEHPKR